MDTKGVLVLPNAHSQYCDRFDQLQLIFTDNEFDLKFNR